MKPLTQQVHDLFREIPLQGETLVDATAGNGHDTMFLAQCAGPNGNVIAIDIQQEAIDQTARRIAEAGYENVTCIKGSHAEMLHLVPETLIGKVAAITFNLGYLPGGSKAIITQTDTTLRAVEASLQLLKPNGILSILAYTGHPGGQEEADTVFEFASQLPKDNFKFQELSPTPSAADSPRLFVIENI